MALNSLINSIKLNNNILKLALLFPGQGIQYSGMLNQFLTTDFLKNNNKENKVINKLDSQIIEDYDNVMNKYINDIVYETSHDLSITNKESLDFRLNDIKFSDILIYKEDDGEMLNKIKSIILNQTKIAQVSIQLFSHLRYLNIIKVIKEAQQQNQDIKKIELYLYGRSLGELSSILLSSNITTKDIAEITYNRGLITYEECPKSKGVMLNIIGDIDKNSLAVREFFNSNKSSYDSDARKSINIAGYHSKKLIVFSGDKDIITQLALFLKQKKITNRLLNVSAAFHSNLMNNARIRLVEYLRNNNYDLSNAGKTDNFDIIRLTTTDINEYSRKYILNSHHGNKEQNNVNVLNYFSSISKEKIVQEIEIDSLDTNSVIEYLGSSLIVSYNTINVMNYLNDRNINTFDLANNNLINYNDFI